MEALGLEQVSYVPARAPSPPVLTATALNDTEILLEWNKPFDNGTDIDGYVVQRFDNEGSWDCTQR